MTRTLKGVKNPLRVTAGVVAVATIHWWLPPLVAAMIYVPFGVADWILVWAAGGAS